jgi:hypothetical protein
MGAVPRVASKLGRINWADDGRSTRVVKGSLGHSSMERWKSLEWNLLGALSMSGCADRLGESRKVEYCNFSMTVEYTQEDFP